MHKTRQSAMSSTLGLLLVLALHASVVYFLRQDVIRIAFSSIAETVTARIIEEPNHTIRPLKSIYTPATIKSVIQPPDIPGIEIIEPPPLDNKPLVKISARFEPDFDPGLSLEQIPAVAHRLRDKVVTELSVQIYADGSVGDIVIEEKSGLPELDRFIAQYAKERWRFLPAMDDGIPVASWQSFKVSVTGKSISVAPK